MKLIFKDCSAMVFNGGDGYKYQNYDCKHGFSVRPPCLVSNPKIKEGVPVHKSDLPQCCWEN
jgi:hypothetical protein